MKYSELERYTYEKLGDLSYEQISSGNRLITNRTQEDVERWNVLRAKGWEAMTELERKEWMGELETEPCAAKGMYTHRDMNRVDGAIVDILNRIKEEGYDTPELILNTGRTPETKIYDSDINVFFSNISVIRDIFRVDPSTPMAPYIGKKMDIDSANDIEKILINVNDTFTRLKHSWYFTGELFIGEV